MVVQVYVLLKQVGIVITPQILQHVSLFLETEIMLLVRFVMMETMIIRKDAKVIVLGLCLDGVVQAEM